MKNIFYVLTLLMSLNIQGQRTLSSNTRVVNVDTISQSIALTINDQGNLALVDLPNGGVQGANNFAQYNSVADFPTVGNESTIYYARTPNEFYIWETDLQQYRLVPVSVKSVTAGNYLENNGTSSDPVLDVQTSPFIEPVDAAPVRNSAINNVLNNISLTGRITKSPVTYRTFSGTDIVAAGGTVEDLLGSISYETDFIAIQATGITYLLKRNDVQVNKILDSQGNIVNFTFFRNELPRNVFTRRYGFFNINTTPKALTNLDPNYTAYSFNGLDEGTGNVSIHTSSTTDQFTVMYSVVSAVSGAAAETITTLVDNGNSFTYTSENGTATTIDMNGGTGASNGNIIVANTLADIQNAPEGAYIDIQSSFPLVADYIAIPNQIWSFSTGSIDTNGFTLTGTNTKPIFNGDLPGIVGEGTIDGTWNAPAVIYATNFGLKGDGKEYETGSITSGSNILTVTGANFTTDDIGHFIAVKGAVAGFIDSSIGQKSLQTTIIAVNSPTEVVVADSATRTTTDATVWTGFDNFQNGKNAIYVRNQKSGKFVFTPGLYFKSEYTFNGALGIDDPVVGWYFGDGTDDIVVEAYGATIASIPHNLRRTRMITYGNTHRFRWSGGILRQDRLMHNYTGQPLADSGDDFNICMYGRTAAYHTHIKDVIMMQTEGTLFSTAGDLQFTNYIKGDNVTNVQQRVTQMVYGDVDDVTGAVTPDANAEFAYTELYLDVSTEQFENTRISKPDRKGRRNYQFAGQASTGWSGLIDKWFKAYYYDSNGDFLYASGEQRFYQTYEYPDEVSFVRIKVNRPPDLSLIDVQVRAPMNGHHLILTNVHLREAAAHALSNMPSHFIMIGGSMKLIGLVLPAFASNTEDQHSTTQDQQFIGVIFENTFTGDLNWINTVGVKVINCTFYGTSDPNYLRTNYTRALSMDDSRDAMAHGNHIFNGSIQVDRNAQLYDNTVINGEIQIRANGADVYDNEFHNVVVANLDAPIADRALSYFKDNRMTHDRPWASYLFTDTNMNVGYEDINIILNDKTRLSNTQDQNTPYERIVLGQNGGSRMWNAAPAPTKDYGGYLKNFSIKGARQPRASRDFASTSIYWPITNYDNVYSEASINLKYGLPKDRTFNDLKIDGFLRIDADQFGDVLTADAPTLTFNRLTVTIPEGEFDWTNTGAAILRVNDKNLNLEFNNALFDLQVVSNEVGTYKKAFRFEQLGTTLFNKSIFKSASAKTIDLNDPVFASVGAITLNDCTCENFTFIGRAGIDTIDCDGGVIIVDGSETKIIAGNNTTVSGSGTEADPYQINTSGGSGGGNGITAGNGVTIDSDVLNLGGTVTDGESISIDLGNATAGSPFNNYSNFSVNHPTGAGIEIGENATGGFTQLSGDSVFITGDNTMEIGSNNALLDLTSGIYEDANTSGGLKYADDYSSNYTDRSLIDLGYFNANNGLDTTQNLTLTDGDNLSPIFNIQNSYASDNYYLRMYFLNSIGYLESERLSDDAPAALRYKGTYFGAYQTASVDLGQSNLGWRDGWFTRKVTAGEFEIIGAPDGILMANGSINTDTYIQAKQNVLTNVNITFDLNDNYKRIRATTGTITYLIPLNSNVAFDPDDTELTIYNVGATSVTIAVEDPSITLSGNAGTVLSPGDKRTLSKLDTDTWFIGY